MKHFIQIVKLPLYLVFDHSTLLWGSPNLGQPQNWDEVNAVCCFYLVLLAGQKSDATCSHAGRWEHRLSMEQVWAWVPALPSPSKFMISLSLLCHGDNFYCISYLLLCKRLPPNEATKHNKQLLPHRVFEGSEFRNVSAGSFWLKVSLGCRKDVGWSQRYLMTYRSVKELLLK